MQTNPPLAFVSPEQRVVAVFQVTVYALRPSNQDPTSAIELPTVPCEGDKTTDGVGTTKDPSAVSPPASVALTVVPDVPLGTENVHENAPVAPVVIEPDVQPAIDTASNTNDARSVDTENPVPETVTEVPIPP